MGQNPPLPSHQQRQCPPTLETLPLTDPMDSEDAPSVEGRVYMSEVTIWIATQSHSSIIKGAQMSSLRRGLTWKHMDRHELPR